MARRNQRRTASVLTSSSNTSADFESSNYLSVSQNQQTLNVVPNNNGTYSVLIRRTRYPVGVSSPSSLLELQSTAGALVFSRMTMNEMNALIPTAGMVVFVTTDSSFYYYDGVIWKKLSGGAGNVVGPSSSVDRDIAIFDGTFGNVIQDSGINITSSRIISNVANPVSDQDVATKNYVDASVNEIDKLLTDFDFNEITNVGTPLSNYSAVNKEYLEEELDRILFLAEEYTDGKSFTLQKISLESTDFDFNEIINVGRPQGQYSAVNKEYLDEQTINTVVDLEEYADTGDVKTFTKTLGYIDTLIDPCDVNFKEIINVGYPQGNYSAVNKEYLEEAIAQAIPEEIPALTPSGNIGIFTGNQTLAGSDITITSDLRISNVTDPVNSRDVATKGYVTSVLNPSLDNLTDFNFNEITNVGIPYGSYSAVNKEYLEEALRELEDELINHIAISSSQETDLPTDFDFNEITNVGMPFGNYSAVNKEYFQEKTLDIVNELEDYADSGNINTLMAAESYADAKDVVTLAAAQAFATLGDSVTLTAAKSYADAGDVTTLNLAKIYADNLPLTLDFDFNEITSVGTPLSNYSAVNKEYLEQSLVNFLDYPQDENVFLRGDGEWSLPYLNNLPINGNVNFQGYDLSGVSSIFVSSGVSTGSLVIDFNPSTNTSSLYSYSFSSSFSKLSLGANSFTGIDITYSSGIGSVNVYSDLSVTGNVIAQNGSLIGSNLKSYTSNPLSVLSPLSMNNNSISNLPSPINALDAANKAYVDAHSSAGGVPTDFDFNEVTNVGTPQGNYSAVNIDYLEKRIASLEQSISNNDLNYTLPFVPTGTMLMHAGGSVPDGYLLCNGKPLESKDYPYLYNAIGTKWGNLYDQLVTTFVSYSASIYSFKISFVSGTSFISRLAVGDKIYLYNSFGTSLLNGGVPYSFISMTAPSAGFVTISVSAAVNPGSGSLVMSPVSFNGGKSIVFNVPDSAGCLPRGIPSSYTNRLWTNNYIDPDFAGRASRYPGGVTSGIGSYQQDAVIQHNHTVTATSMNSLGKINMATSFSDSATNYPCYGVNSSGTLNIVNTSVFGSTDNYPNPSGTTETRPNNFYVNFIIKY